MNACLPFLLHARKVKPQLSQVWERKWSMIFDEYSAADEFRDVDIVKGENENYIPRYPRIH